MGLPVVLENLNTIQSDPVEVLAGKVSALATKYPEVFVVLWPYQNLIDK